MPGDWAPKSRPILVPAIEANPALGKYADKIPSLENWKCATSRQMPALNLLVDDVSAVAGCKKPEVCAGYFLGSHAIVLDSPFRKESIICFDLELLKEYASGKYALQEVKAVIAHELGHLKKSHTLKSLSLRILLKEGTWLASLGILIAGLPPAVAIAGVAVNTLAYFFRKQILNMFHRSLEYSADKFSATVAGAKSAASYFEKTAAEELRPDAEFLHTFGKLAANNPMLGQFFAPGCGSQPAIRDFALQPFKFITHNEWVQNMLANSRSDHPSTGKRIARLEKIRQV
ncbi:MAG TPA: M48 family metalloprotease, partial [Candidatus Micrarchaeota archaeon]|nr:M48 family metalloprotease [Candidatus Micrarchaeota archaeon]